MHQVSQTTHSPRPVEDPFTGGGTGIYTITVPDHPNPSEPTWDDVLAAQEGGYEYVEEEWDGGETIVQLRREGTL